MFFKGALFEFACNEGTKFSQSQLGLMLEAPSKDKVENFHKISILVAPPGVKSVAVCDDNAEELCLSNGWTKQLAGTCPERSYAICGSLKAQRR